MFGLKEIPSDRIAQVEIFRKFFSTPFWSPGERTYNLNKLILISGMFYFSISQKKLLFRNLAFGFNSAVSLFVNQKHITMESGSLWWFWFVIFRDFIAFRDI